MRTKIPHLNDFYINDYEVRDRDAERKEKGKDYGRSMELHREHRVMSSQ